MAAAGNEHDRLIRLCLDTANSTSAARFRRNKPRPHLGGSRQHPTSNDAGDGRPIASAAKISAGFIGRCRTLSTGVVTHHPVPAFFFLCLLMFMYVEYTIPMVSPSSPPLDLGFLATAPLNAMLASNPVVNSLLAGLNTVFVGMQGSYILWALAVEGRPRATIAALFLFACRGVLGCCTQLPVPQGFLGSGADFPVGNVSFFLFFSGHVAGAIIAAADMRRMSRRKMAAAFDLLNALQCVRLLASRGHYTIDLAAGVGAGYLFDHLAGDYLRRSISH